LDSRNFHLLADQWPELYRHAALAEQYVQGDPATATIKLRCFAESLVGFLYRHLGLRSNPEDGLFERLTSYQFESIVETSIRQKLHAIRIVGNKAAHGKEVAKEQALQILKDAYLLGHWIYSTFYSGHAQPGYPEFEGPVSPEELNSHLKATNEDLRIQLESAKEELQKLQTDELRAQEQIVVDISEEKLSRFHQASAAAASRIDLGEEATRRLLSLEDSFSEYNLTNGQVELTKKLGDFLSSRNESVFLLRGYAGTGKTFITKGLTEYFRAIGRNYVLAAPTGKAAKVIVNKTKSPAYTLHRTIYSFKDIREYTDADVEGTETYKFYAELSVNASPADTVFIVDEASMVSDAYSEAEFFRFGSGYILRDFLKYVNLDHNDHSKKIIFIGDDAQLPPVSMSFSPALDEKYLLREYGVRSTSYELTEVVRQKADSGVMVNSIMLRNAMKNRVFNQLAVDFNTPDIQPINHGDLMGRYLDSCGGKINGESIVIAYSNADVAAYNRQIREHFFPGCEHVQAGDKVMALSNSSAYGFFICNGDFGIIREILRATEFRQVTIKRRNEETGVVESASISLAFKDVVVGFRDIDGTAKFFEAKIIESLLYSDLPSLSSDESKALYIDFCMRNKGLTRGGPEFKNTLMSDPYFNALRLKFGYAITCHKAQGSEWNNVFVKCKTNQNQLTEGYFRWFYTAITRTADRLWLLDSPNLKIGSGLKSVRRPGIGMLNPTPTQQDAPASFDLQGNQIAGVYRSVKEEQAVTSYSLSGVQRPIGVDETYGIPEGAKFLLGLLGRVRELIADHGISIDSITHQQYQEAYIFSRGNEFARVDIGYDSKEKIKRVTTPIPSPLSVDVKNILTPLVGRSIAGGSVLPADQIQFEDDFINDFHQRLIPLAAERQINIQNAEKYQWHVRYSFARGNDVAVCDMFFDGKKRFTKYQPLITACSPGSLLPDIEVILTQGLSA
jgi:hypothetical protein